MAVYRVQFVDHGEHVYSAAEFERESDAEAVEAAHRLNVSSIGHGFDLWREDRLVHRHRGSPG